MSKLIGLQTPYFDTAYDGIFVEKFSNKGLPLFDKQVELSEVIRKHPQSGFNDTQDTTIRSALSQIFNGERNLSNNLRRALFLVIEPRFNKNKFDYVKFEKLLIKRFQEAYEKRLQTKRESEPDRDYDELIERTRTGTHLLITTLEPAELHKSELANRLKDILLEKTGIIPKTYYQLTPGEYKFYLPDIRIAREFWEALKRHVVNMHDIDSKTADKKIRHANEGGKIKTYLAPLELAMHPYIFIDYLNPNIATSFCVSYRNREIPSVAEMSFLFVDEWLKKNDEMMRAEIEKKIISFIPKK